MRTEITPTKKSRPRIKKAAAAIRSTSQMKESVAEYVIYVAVPGMERKDFSVRICKNSLIVSADKNEALHCLEQAGQTAYAHWTQTFTLPDDADTVMTAAVYRRGELEIHIPRGKKGVAGMPFDIFVY